MRSVTKSFTATIADAAAADRSVTQIVSVFGAADMQGDRVMPGAFTATLERWAASPNTLSAYFSHGWGDPFYNVGGVTAAEELAPGDERLPDNLAQYGGLLVAYQFDPEYENAVADQVYRLMQRRRIFEASIFALVVSERTGVDGVTELTELDLIEVGPTLKGVAYGTQVLSVNESDLTDDAGSDEQPADEQPVADDAPAADTSVQTDAAAHAAATARVRLEADLIDMGKE